MKPSLLLITDSPDFGGAESAMITAAEGLAAQGAQVTVAIPALNPRLAAATAQLVDQGIPVIRADGPLSPGRLGMAVPVFRRAVARRVRPILQRVAPDVIIVNLRNVWRGAAILDAARANGKRCCIAGFVHLAHLPSAFGAPFSWWRDRLVPGHLARFDVLLTVSRSQERILPRREGRPAIATVYPPTREVRRRERPARQRARELLGIDADQVIGMTSRIVFRQKGQDVAVRLALRLRERGLDPHWVVVGDGSDLPRLRNMVAEAGLDERFHFLGWRSDLPDLIRGFDVLAMPSRLEGLPLAAVEGMAAGVPVVAFGVDGLAELLPASFAVPPGDEAAFTDALEAVLRSPGRWPAADSAALAARLCDPGAVAARILRAVSDCGGSALRPPQQAVAHSLETPGPAVPEEYPLHRG